MKDDDRTADALRRAADYRSDDHVGEEPQDEQSQQEQSGDEQQAARSRRLEDQAQWVDLQVRAAIDRGDFDDLPWQGQPLPDRLSRNDPDWWVKQLIEREQITGVLPPALGLRREDAELNDRLDSTGSEERVRDLLADFNARVVEARRQLLGGPPVVTPPRDVEEEVAAWRRRRSARAAAVAQTPQQQPRKKEHRRRGRLGRWFGRR